MKINTTGTAHLTGTRAAVTPCTTTPADAFRTVSKTAMSTVAGVPAYLSDQGSRTPQDAQALT